MARFLLASCFNPTNQAAFKSSAAFFYVKKKMNEKKKHNWMRGFVIPPRSTEAEILTGERSRMIKARMQTKTGRKNGE
jgi:hypothetical protein